MGDPLILLPHPLLIKAINKCTKLMNTLLPGKATLLDNTFRYCNENVM